MHPQVRATKINVATQRLLSSLDGIISKKSKIKILFSNPGKRTQHFFQDMYLIGTFLASRSQGAVPYKQTKLEISLSEEFARAALKEIPEEQLFKFLREEYQNNKAEYVQYSGCELNERMAQELEELRAPNLARIVRKVM